VGHIADDAIGPIDAAGPFLGQGVEVAPPAGVGSTLTSDTIGWLHG
jgi:hypothetical protein